MDKETLSHICQAYGYKGTLLNYEVVEDGLSHQSWIVKTDKATLFLKHLNPFFWQQAEYLQNFTHAEAIARAFKAKSLPVEPALLQNGECFIRCKENIYTLMPYIDNSKVVTLDAIERRHTCAIASTLATMHQIDLPLQQLPAVIYPDFHPTYWQDVIKQLISIDSPLAEHVKQCLPYISQVLAKADSSAHSLQEDKVISHRDLSNNNVVWLSNEVHYIIDWESAGLINRTKDVINTAIYWSINSAHAIDLEKFAAFIDTYQQEAAAINSYLCDASIYSLLIDWIHWLDINIRRLVDDKTSVQERVLSTEQAHNTLSAIPIVLSQLPEMINTI